MALAIVGEADAIGIWGVDMELSSEYGHQRPSCEYFVGIADGLGIEMIVPERSDICKARKLYAFQDDKGFNAKMVAKRAHLEKIRAQLDAEERQAALNKAGMDGAIEMLKLVTESWEI